MAHIHFWLIGVDGTSITSCTTSSCNVESRFEALLAVSTWSQIPSINIFFLHVSQLASIGNGDVKRGAHILYSSDSLKNLEEVVRRSDQPHRC